MSEKIPEQYEMFPENHDEYAERWQELDRLLQEPRGSRYPSTEVDGLRVTLIPEKKAALVYIPNQPEIVIEEDSFGYYSPTGTTNHKLPLARINDWIHEEMAKVEDQAA